MRDERASMDDDVAGVINEVAKQRQASQVGWPWLGCWNRKLGCQNCVLGPGSLCIKLRSLGRFCHC